MTGDCIERAVRTKAPGKLVISGAYAVLEGAPAIVTAVDRYVVADMSRQATFEAPEVRAAKPVGPLPYFDASALRDGDRKLGLGSSAAIVVASVAALTLEQNPQLTTHELRDHVCDLAVRSHQQAQKGGSGIDVVTSIYGGTRLCFVKDGQLSHEAHAFAAGVEIEVFCDANCASTASMLATVRAWKQRDADRYRALMQELHVASTKAKNACNVVEFVHAIGWQTRVLTRLGRESGAPIVPNHLDRIARSAIREGVAVHPSGAGGGDMVLCIGEGKAVQDWSKQLEKEGYLRLHVGLGARGVHRVEEST